MQWRTKSVPRKEYVTSLARKTERGGGTGRIGKQGRKGVQDSPVAAELDLWAMLGSQYVFKLKSIVNALLHKHPPERIP